MLPFKKILCPTDFSEPSYEAVKAASELAQHFSAELHLVHVIRPIPDYVAPDPSVFNIALYYEGIHRAANEEMQKLIDRFGGKEVSTNATVVEGNAADEIIRIADNNEVDLTVIATHGQTGVRRLVFGSVAEKVVRLAAGPVLTIRIQHEED